MAIMSMDWSLIAYLQRSRNVTNLRQRRVRLKNDVCGRWGKIYRTTPFEVVKKEINKEINYPEV
jgi:hypothetical protein